MAIPEDFVKRNVEKSKGCCFFGVPIEEMTRDELIACCIDAQNNLMDLHVQYKADLNS